MVPVVNYLCDEVENIFTELKYLLQSTIRNCYIYITIAQNLC